MNKQIDWDSRELWDALAAAKASEKRLYQIRREIDSLFSEASEIIMKDFQKRVVEERDDLKGKMERLGKFLNSDIYAGLPEGERVRLRHQLQVMGMYHDILCERIRNFK